MPVLAYDGGNVYVSMAVHDEAVEWFVRHMGWKLQHKFDNLPNNPENTIVRERKTLLGFGTSIQSIDIIRTRYQQWFPPNRVLSGVGARKIYPPFLSAQ